MDESGIDRDEIKQTAWIKKGDNIIQDISGQMHNRTTIIAALNTKDDIIAPFYFEGYTDTEIVLLWLEEYLLPELKEKYPSKTKYIIMDNASFHKSIKIREAIEKAGHKLIYLPPYSPDFNPIENYWNFLKQHVRKLRLKCSNFYRNLEEALNMRYVAMGF